MSAGASIQIKECAVLKQSLGTPAFQKDHRVLLLKSGNLGRKISLVTTAYYVKLELVRNGNGLKQRTPGGFCHNPTWAE